MIREIGNLVNTDQQSKYKGDMINIFWLYQGAVVEN